MIKFLTLKSQINWYLSPLKNSPTGFLFESNAPITNPLNPVELADFFSSLTVQINKKKAFI